MKMLMLDTCVWIDLVLDYPGLLDRVQHVVRDRLCCLLLPRTVREEWDRLKGGLPRRAADKASGAFGSVRGVRRYFEDSEWKQLKDVLGPVDARVSEAGNKASQRVSAVDTLMGHSSTIVVEVTDDVRATVVAWGLEKKMPLVAKNAVADALIVASTFEYVSTNPGAEVIFVTVNTEDFAAPDDKKVAHPDLAEGFASRRIQFCVNPAQALNEIAAGAVHEKVVASVEVDLAREQWVRDLLRRLQTVVPQGSLEVAFKAASEQSKRLEALGRSLAEGYNMGPLEEAIRQQRELARMIAPSPEYLSMVEFLRRMSEQTDAFRSLGNIGGQRAPEAPDEDPQSGDDTANTGDGG